MTANVYAGVNAHLNSYLQRASGRWRGFHALHIAELVRALEAVLPPEYESVPEESLQIVRSEPPDSHTVATVADVLIYGESTTRYQATNTATPTATEPLVEALSEEDVWTAAVIYRRDALSGDAAAVTRLEVLSPANKWGGSHYSAYKQKRLATLQSGLNLVELDYLHEQPPLDPRIPAYSDGQPNAHPFMIVVSVPQPTFVSGYYERYEVGVDEALPAIPLPLDGDNRVRLDIDAVYQATFTATRAFANAIRYAEPPPAFERYSADDQARIRAVMARAAQMRPPAPG